MNKANSLRKEWGGILAAVLLIVGGSLWAYWPSFSGKFFLDDDGAILSNPHLKQLWPLGPILNPPGWMATLAGRPVLSLSLAINRTFGGDAVFGYHVVNLAIHMLAGILLWLIVWTVLRLPGISERIRRSAWWLATVSALVWTLHPLQTESVTYIVQRAECMAGMFYLAALFLFVAGTQATLRRNKIWLMGGVGVACLLAIGTKESGATIPVAILLMDRAYLSESWKRCLWRGRGVVYGGLFSCWLFQGVLMTASSQRGSTAGFGLGMTSWDYAVSQFGIIARYLRLTFWPHPLVLDYGVWLAKTPGEIVPYAILIVGLVVGSMGLWFYDKRWGFPALFFWLTLGPTSSVVPLVTQTAAEHRMYLPLAGLIPLCVVGGWYGWSNFIEQLRAKKWDVGPPMLIGKFAAAAMIMGCGRLTYERNLLYQDPIAMWRANTEAWPRNARGYSSLASKLFEAGRYVESLEACEATIAREANYPGIHFLEGEIFSRLGRTPEMMASYGEEIRLHPDHSWSFHNRGVAKFSQGDLKGAEEDLIEAVKRRPDLAEYHLNLGKARQQRERFEEAVESYSEVLRIDPRKVEAYQLRGMVYSRLGKLKEAEVDFTRALELDRRLIPAYFSRGIVRRQEKKLAEAVADFTRVIELNPQAGDAYEERARTYLAAGETSRAKGDVQRCQRMGMKLDAELLKLVTP